MFAQPEIVKNVQDMVLLWLHESCRVYCDKLVDEKDMELYNKISVEIAEKHFEDISEEHLRPVPHIYCHFAKGVAEPKYSAVTNWEDLNKILVDALENYNEINAVMNLVLFEDAMAHM